VQLGRADASITDLAEKFHMTLTGMKKHVGVLEQAGLVTTEKVGRVRTCKLGLRRLEEEAAWIERYPQLWDARFKQWWVPKSMGMFLRTCEMDVRVGGKYRLEFEPDAMAFFGTYLEVTRRDVRSTGRASRHPGRERGTVMSRRSRGRPLEDQRFQLNRNAPLRSILDGRSWDGCAAPTLGSPRAGRFGAEPLALNC